MSNAINANTSIASYDFIIAGAGGAGLSLLHYLMESPTLSSKSILVVDRSFEKTNDRTWCFWDTPNSAFEKLIHYQWNIISIHNEGFNKELPTSPFSYKMIQGIDFYNAILQTARAKENIHFKQATILDISVDTFSTSEGHSKKQAIVKWEGGAAKGNYVFSSLLPFQMNQLSMTVAFEQLVQKTATKKNRLPFLWQHFKGRVIEFEEPLFNKSTATLMDFNVPQQAATAFMYQLPLSTTKALVEYTIFSEKVLAIETYDEVLESYLAQKFPEKKYTITHEEIGAIPMTQIQWGVTAAPIYTIGALGAAIKASTGYAFQFIQKQCKNIVFQLEYNLPIQTKIHTTRHQFYDAVLLHILFHHKMKGADIFTRIFAKNEAATVFKFLSNTSSIWEDIKIMRSLPTSIFLPAALQVLFRRS